jgi:hypothetical protein
VEVSDTAETEDDLRRMTVFELQELRVELKDATRNIQAQLEQWSLNALPAHMLTKEWRRRASNALAWHKGRLDQVGLETVRRTAVSHRETPEQKAARVAATDASRKDMNGAFVRTVAKRVSDEEFRSIWGEAQDLFPECFSKDEP